MVKEDIMNTQYEKFKKLMEEFGVYVYEDTTDDGEMTISFLGGRNPENGVIWNCETYPIFRFDEKGRFTVVDIGETGMD